MGGSVVWIPIPGSRPIFSIPNLGIGDAVLKSRDFGIVKNEQNAPILRDICPKNTFFPEFWGKIPGSKADSERTRPQHQLRHHGGHRSTGAIVLNKLFMRIRALITALA